MPTCTSSFCHPVGWPQIPENLPVSLGPRPGLSGSQEDHPAPPRSPVSPSVSGYQAGLRAPQSRDWADHTAEHPPNLVFLSLAQTTVLRDFLCNTHAEPRKLNCPSVCKEPSASLWHYPAAPGSLALEKQDPKLCWSQASPGHAPGPSRGVSQTRCTGAPPGIILGTRPPGCSAPLLLGEMKIIIISKTSDSPSQSTFPGTYFERTP